MATAIWKICHLRSSWSQSCYTDNIKFNWNKKYWRERRKSVILNVIQVFKNCPRWMFSLEVGLHSHFNTWGWSRVLQRIKSCLILNSVNPHMCPDCHPKLVLPCRTTPHTCCAHDSPVFSLVTLESNWNNTSCSQSEGNGSAEWEIRPTISALTSNLGQMHRNRVNKSPFQWLTHQFYISLMRREDLWMTSDTSDLTGPACQK